METYDQVFKIKNIYDNFRDKVKYYVIEESI